MRIWAERYWLIVLAIPYLVAIALLAGMTRTMPVFHGGDERFHYDVILRFAHEPFMKVVRDYTSANGPFYYLLFGVVGRVVGFELWKMRLLNVLVSYAAVVVVFLLLRKRLAVPPWRALVAAVVIELSPYFFSSSLILLTDNLTWALVFGAIYLWLTYQESGAARSAAWGCVAIALACFTRQNAVWVVFPAMAAILWSRASARSRILSCAGVAVALAPLTFLVVVWGGLVPPNQQQFFGSAGLFNLRVLLFILALFGLYALFIAPWEWVRGVLRRPGAFYWSLGALGAAIVVNAMRPLHRVVTRLVASDGYLWRLSTLGQRGDASLVLWALIPIGAVVVVWLGLTATRRNALFWGGSLVAFVVVSATSAEAYQKYYDVFVLFVLLAWPYGLAREAATRSSVVDGSRLFALSLLFVAYPIGRAALGF